MAKILEWVIQRNSRWNHEFIRKNSVISWGLSLSLLVQKFLFYSRLHCLSKVELFNYIECSSLLNALIWQKWTLLKDRTFAVTVRTPFWNSIKWSTKEFHTQLQAVQRSYQQNCRKCWTWDSRMLIRRWCSYYIILQNYWKNC